MLKSLRIVELFVFVTLMCFWLSCDMPGSGKNEKDRISIALADSVLSCDSLYISVWSADGSKLLQDLHGGAFRASIFEKELNSSLPSTFVVMVKGFDKSGMVVYHGQRLYNGGSFEVMEDVLHRKSKFLVSLSPLKDSVLEGENYKWTLKTDYAPASVYWIVNDTLYMHTQQSQLIVYSLARKSDAIRVHAVVENKDGYITSNEAVLYIKSKASPNLNSPIPSQGETIKSVVTTLSWPPLIGGDVWTYTVLFGKDSAYMDTLAANILSTSQVTYPLESKQEYVWRVLATSPQGSQVSPNWIFYTPSNEGLINTSPNVPSALSPAHGQLNVSDSVVTLSWSGGDLDPLDDPLVKYSIVLSTHNPPEDGMYRTLLSNLQTEKVLEVRNLKKGTDYFWRVYATDGKATTTSPIWSFRTMSLPYLTIISPSSGSLLQDGTYMNIEWNSAGVDSVNIMYTLDGGVNWKNLANHIKNNYGYPWKVDSVETKNAMIAVRDTKGTIGDTTDYFSITTQNTVQSLKITSPVVGQQVDVGGLFVLRWATLGNIPKVRLLYDQGAVWKTIVDSIENKGSYEWLVPTSLTNTSAIIKIQSLDTSISNTLENPVYFRLPSKYSKWSHKAKIVYGNIGDSIQNRVTYFPLAIDLDSTTTPFKFSQAKPNGADIRFTKSDSVTPLPYYIESWDAMHSKALVWVMIDTVYQKKANQSIVMYWGNPDGLDSSSSKSVFSSENGYEGVWLLSESAQSEAVMNATLVTADTLKKNTKALYTSKKSAEGLLGGCFNFNGDSSWVDLGSTKFLTGKSAATISVWIGENAVDKDQQIVSLSVGKPNTQDSRIALGMSGSNSSVDYTIRTTDNTTTPLNSKFYISKNLFWKHLALTVDLWGDTYSLYINGVLKISADITDGNLFPLTESFESAIGAQDDGKGGYLYGKIDQVEISSVARSADYIKLQFETQSNGRKFLVWQAP